MEIEEAFLGWVKADAEIARIKGLQQDLEHEIHLAENAETEAMNAVLAVMAETGEYEALIVGEYCNYKIYYTTPKESVKVSEPDSVPDRLCEIKRVPKLREIKAELSMLKEKGEPVPNWATVDLGEKKLSYKVMKK